jgi:hypothetical protein
MIKPSLMPSTRSWIHFTVLSSENTRSPNGNKVFLSVLVCTSMAVNGLLSGLRSSKPSGSVATSSSTSYRPELGSGIRHIPAASLTAAPTSVPSASRTMSVTPSTGNLEPVSSLPFSVPPIDSVAPSAGSVSSWADAGAAKADTPMRATRAPIKRRNHMGCPVGLIDVGDTGRYSRPNARVK